MNCDPACRCPGCGTCDSAKKYQEALSRLAAAEERAAKAEAALAEAKRQSKFDWESTSILVTGGRGFLGQHVLAAMKRRGATCFHPTPEQCDWTRVLAVRKWLASYSPDMVLHLAAVVGGIGANRARPADFFYENALMGIQLLHESWEAGVEKFVATGTICAYPKHTLVPFKEADLWKGYPEETNAPYGIAKKLLSVQAAAYREQYGFNAVVVYPVNLYGPGDHFNLETSHVIPAMIRKFSEAKVTGQRSVELWGSGNATREFLYVQDCAEALLQVIESYDSSEPLNLGTGEEIQICALADKIRRLVGYQGTITWNTTYPDGQPRRCVDTTRAQALGIRPQTSLDEGLARTVEWYVREFADRP
jgi:GDP-L-fucose synthase